MKLDEISGTTLAATRRALAGCAIAAVAVFGAAACDNTDEIEQQVRDGVEQEVEEGIDGVEQEVEEGIQEGIDGVFGGEGDGDEGGGDEGGDEGGDDGDGEDGDDD